ncbi:response regulator transcription factor [Endozoicomonas sp. G2_1]|uniref:response regulator n=1 Tax=Endozoicomonas sp. G2_1 TaxID=2821091 RepID=UPI001ADD0A2A|nr:response regulator transcription factor [Endozoicomonas sp. G2_1]MBO9491648.1 response regulator transcription factor [Endozoicomonas sp. G2_1]
MTIKILLVDDQNLVRAGIKSLLGLSEKVSVVAEASDGSEVLAKVEATEPDVILLDLSMPVMDGIATLAALNQANIATPVVILTTFDDHELVLRGLKAGAKGYLLKDVSLDSLIQAIETVDNGETLVQPALTERLLQGLSTIAPEFELPAAIEALTTKETEVLRLMASGYSNKEISTALFKSEGTVKNHVSSILTKLGVRDRTRAVLLAIEKGLLS